MNDTSVPDDPFRSDGRKGSEVLAERLLGE
jgi:hypothetical protein